MLERSVRLGLLLHLEAGACDVPQCGAGQGGWCSKLVFDDSEELRSKVVFPRHAVPSLDLRPFFWSVERAQQHILIIDDQ